MSMLAVAAVTALWMSDGPSLAHEPHAALSFSMAVDENGDTVNDCYSPCTVDPGATFALTVNLNNLGGVPSYEAFDAFVTYSGVTVTGVPSFPWPQCVFGPWEANAGELRAGCTIGIAAPPSTYVGVMVRQTFECGSSPGTFTLHHSAALGDTRLIEYLGSMHSEGNGTTETFDVLCEYGPPPYVDRTFTNTSPVAAANLTSSVWSYPGSVMVITNAPGCPAPSVWHEFSSFSEVWVNWGVNCIDPGESVTIRATADCPWCSINLGPGTWGYGPDIDGDGCSDPREQQTEPGSELSGGLRDDQNPGDYFNPTHDHMNRIDDVLMVVDQYYIDVGNPNYNSDTDRVLPEGAPHPWSLQGGNGEQRVDDILNMVKQYYHDCW